MPKVTCLVLLTTFELAECETKKKRVATEKRAKERKNILPVDIP